jgi:hypothetical protein
LLLSFILFPRLILSFSTQQPTLKKKKLKRKAKQMIAEMEVEKTETKQ